MGNIRSYRDTRCSLIVLASHNTQMSGSETPDTHKTEKIVVNSPKIMYLGLKIGKIIFVHITSKIFISRPLKIGTGVWSEGFGICLGGLVVEPRGIWNRRRSPRRNLRRNISLVCQCRVRWRFVYSIPGWSGWWHAERVLIVERVHWWTRILKERGAGTCKKNYCID